MEVKVTGGSGFLGANLTSYLLANKINVHQISRNELANTSYGLNNCAAVIHLAGKAHDLKKVANPDEYYKVNFELTKKLFDAFLLSDASKFIFISSVKAVADEVNGILTENTKANPQTDYGKSKLMAERYIQSQTMPTGKSYYILRPCMIHGPGNKGNLNLLFNFVQKGIPYPLAAFKNNRSFLSVENLCFVISELLIANDIASGVYNVADDQALSTNKLIQLICENIGKKASLWYVPMGLIKTIAKIGDVIKLPINTERLNKLTQSYVIDNSKITLALNKKMPVEATDGISRTIKSFKIA